MTTENSQSQETTVFRIRLPIELVNQLDEFRVDRRISSAAGLARTYIEEGLARDAEKRQIVLFQNLIVELRSAGVDNEVIEQAAARALSAR